MIKLGPMIDWPPGNAEKEAAKPDTRMVRCVLPGYLDCMAKCPEACICNKLTSAQYLERMERKYGKSNG